FSQPADVALVGALARRFRIAADAGPAAQQRLVADIDDRPVGKVRRRRERKRRDDEGTVIGPEAIEDHANIGALDLSLNKSFGDEPRKRTRAANGAAILVDFPERAEDILDGAFLAGKRVADFIGVGRQRSGETPDFAIVALGQPAAWLRSIRRGAFSGRRLRAPIRRSRAHPQSREAVLQDWQLVDFLFAVDEQAFDEFRFDGSAGKFDRLADGFFALVLGQGRHQELRRANRLGQTVKPGAIADEIGSHGDDDTYLAGVIAGG